MCSSFVIFISVSLSLSFFLIAGSVEEDTHGETTDETCNGDGPVESFVVSRKILHGFIGFLVSSPFLNCWCEKIMMSETYMTQEKNKSPTRCQLTALKVPLQRPTPTVAPVMHMDVETGSLYCEKMRMVMAAPVSKEELALVIVLAQMVWQGNCSVTYPSPWKSHAKVSGR